MRTLSTMRWAAHEDGAKMVDRLGELVSCESPPGSIPHLRACADLVAGWGEAVLGRPARRVVRDGLPHLLWAARDQRVLLLGHFDTVWPAGTIRQWPFTVDGDRATGPGAYDMKAGIVQMFTALGLLADTSRVGVLLTCDEESGSVTSRELIERQALRSGAVLVCEASDPTGALKVARKGGSLYRLTAVGRAAHAGVEPQRGVNATVEVAHQVLTVQSFASPAEETSVTPTVLAGGTTTNTVPESATLCVDVRAWTRDELERVDLEIRGMTARLPGAVLSVGGGINRHPLTPEVALPLLAVAQAAARDIGLPPPDGAHVPGASDANFTGALGVPTLDGLGAVGGGAHARGEYVEVRTMPDRAALLAALVGRLLTTPS
ncbi:M20 family metallopeptidase [Streptosporangium saharense]|uniref:M20 family metallopeptidase n=1 Tax=Streptosporangium saharense TaxID=1706840 RepID=UPI003441017C